MAAACAVAGAGSAPLLSGAAAAAALARAGVRLCAFDFDLTLTRIHTVGARIPAEAVPLREPLSADFFDLPFVAELLAALPAAGIAPHIVSFGRYAVIQAYMDRALGRGALGRASISTPSVVGVPDGCYVAVGADKVGSKVPQLQALAAATGVPAAATLFLDGA